jgi:hypothetical protein
LAWHVAHIGEKRKAYRILMRNPEGKRPLGRSLTNVKLDLTAIGLGDVEFISLRIRTSGKLL